MADEPFGLLDFSIKQLVHIFSFLPNEDLDNIKLLNSLCLRVVCNHGRLLYDRATEITVRFNPEKDQPERLELKYSDKNIPSIVFHNGLCFKCEFDPSLVRTPTADCLKSTRITHFFGNIILTLTEKVSRKNLETLVPLIDQVDVLKLECTFDDTVKREDYFNYLFKKKKEMHIETDLPCSLFDNEFWKVAADELLWIDLDADPAPLNDEQLKIVMQREDIGDIYLSFGCDVTSQGIFEAIQVLLHNSHWKDMMFTVRSENFNRSDLLSPEGEEMIFIIQRGDENGKEVIQYEMMNGRYIRLYFKHKENLNLTFIMIKTYLEFDGQDNESFNC